MDLVVVRPYPGRVRIICCCDSAKKNNFLADILLCSYWLLSKFGNINIHPTSYLCVCSLARILFSYKVKIPIPMNRNVTLKGTGPG